jgi:hypothetical protein
MFQTHRETLEDTKAIRMRIRRPARECELVATRSKGLWYFGDCNNYLQSPETGLDDAEALHFLQVA